MKGKYKSNITAIIAGIILAVLFSSCSMAAKGAEEAQENLKSVFEGYQLMDTVLIKSSGEEVGCRTYSFIIENTSDKDIRKAGVYVGGFDENGEKIARESGGKASLPYLKPGERAIISVAEAEWKEFPASFQAEPTEIVWGDSDGQHLSIMDVYINDRRLSCTITIKNDSDEECVWLNNLSDQSGTKGRIPLLIAVNKDTEGNVQSIDTGALLDGDSLSYENITFAPGEEKELGFCFSEPLQEPEIMICWQ